MDRRSAGGANTSVGSDRREMGEGKHPVRVELGFAFTSNKLQGTSLSSFTFNLQRFILLPHDLGIMTVQRIYYVALSRARFCLLVDGKKKREIGQEEGAAAG